MLQANKVLMLARSSKKKLSNLQNVNSRKLQSIVAFPVTFMDLMAPVFNPALKAGHVGFVTDTYMQCISGSL